MKHAIFVAFHYPPEASSSGVLRTLKFTKYLPNHNWKVTVISPNVDAYEVTDPDLEAQIPKEVQVVHTPYLNSKKHFSFRGRYPVLTAIPDRWIGWYPWAVAAGRRIAKKEKVDLVYSTSPYATTHLIGKTLAKYIKCPSVIDFRDPWYEIQPELDTPPIRHFFSRLLEKKVVAQASQVITSTQELRNTLAARYPDQENGKFKAILNGFDEDDFLFMDDDNSGKYRQSECLTIVHAGSINAEFRDPRPFLLALKTCVDRLALKPGQIVVRFIGPGDFAGSGELQQFLKSYRLSDYVEIMPRMAYKDALKELRAADLLLLLQASDDTRSLVPAKLYEYLRIQKPVLALVLSGAVSEILTEAGGAWTVDPKAKDELSKTVATIIQLWQQKKLYLHHASITSLMKFERRNLTKQLSGVFDSLVG